MDRASRRPKLRKLACPTIFSNCRPLHTPRDRRCSKALRTRHTLRGLGRNVEPSNSQPSTFMWLDACSTSWTTRPFWRNTSTPRCASFSTLSLFVPRTTQLSTYSKCMQSSSGTMALSSMEFSAVAPISLTIRWWIIWHHHRAWLQPIGKTRNWGKILQLGETATPSMALTPTEPAWTGHMVKKRLSSAGNSKW